MALAWYITDGVLQSADSAPAAHSILTDITGQDEVVIPEGVTVIGKSAFREGWTHKLKSVVIPEGVMRIEQEAFAGCAGLKSLSLPQSLTYIGEKAFYRCGLMNGVRIPQNVTEIGEKAFQECGNVGNIRVPGGVKCIGEDAFLACGKYAVITLEISENVMQIEPAVMTSTSFQAVDIAPGHPVFRLEDGFLISKEGALAWVHSQEERIVLPQGITAIEAGAFKACWKLKSVVIPEGVKRIGACAFKQKWNLEEVSLPEGLTYIGEGAFASCERLTGVVLPQSLMHIGKHAFYRCDGLTEICIPDGITRIEDGAFEWCKNLTRAVLPESVEYIGASAFEGCKMLCDVRIPSGVTHIGEKAFSGCRMTEIDIPDGVTEVPFEAFNGCREAKRLRLGRSMKRIGDWAFAYCEGISEAVIPEGVTEIGDMAFASCGLSRVTLPEGVTRIGNSAFFGCGGLTEIRLPDSVASLGESAFSFCGGLEEIHLGSSLECVGAKAFENCCALKRIVFPDSVKEIGDEAFTCCFELESITLGGSIERIGRDVIRNYAKLKEVTVSSVPGGARFEGDLLISGNGVLVWSRPQVTEVVTPADVTKIGDYAFFGREQLISIVIGDGVTELGRDAFKGCTALTCISMPGSLLASLDKKVRAQMKIFRCTSQVGKLPAAVRASVYAEFARQEETYPQEVRAEYFAEIGKSASKLAEAACTCPALLHIMCREKLISAKDVDKFIAEASKQSNVEATAVLLEYQAHVVTMKEVSKARERKARTREKQDETVIERMEARVEKKGIAGLNFVVTGRLDCFEKRDDIKAYITGRGAKLLSSMSAKADYLITNDIDTGSAKNVKAAELGIEIITEKEFMKMAEEA